MTDDPMLKREYYVFGNPPMAYAHNIWLDFLKLYSLQLGKLNMFNLATLEQQNFKLA